MADAMKNSTASAAASCLLIGLAVGFVQCTAAWIVYFPIVFMFALPMSLLFVPLAKRMPTSQGVWWFVLTFVGLILLDAVSLNDALLESMLWWTAPALAIVVMFGCSVKWPQRSIPDGTCKACRYSLSAIPDTVRCPECGAKRRVKAPEPEH